LYIRIYPISQESGYPKKVLRRERRYGERLDVGRVQKESPGGRGKPDYRRRRERPHVPPRLAVSSAGSGISNNVIRVKRRGWEKKKKAGKDKTSR